MSGGDSVADLMIDQAGENRLDGISHPIAVLPVDIQQFRLLERIILVVTGNPLLFILVFFGLIRSAMRNQHTDTTPLRKHLALHSRAIQTKRGVKEVEQTGMV